MQFSFDHELDLPRDAVELGLMSPELARLWGEKWAALASVETVDHRVDGGRIERVWRCQAKGPLPILENRNITRDMMTWEEIWTYDTARHEGTWRITPRPGVDMDAPWRQSFAMSGDYRLDPLADGRTRRRVSGEVTVKLFMVGSVVERFAVAELTKAYQAEAEALTILSSLP